MRKVVRIGGGVDSADLNNWLRFHRVTRYEPMIASLRYFTNVDEIKTELSKTNGTIITMASLYPENGDSSIDVRVGYRCRGFVSPANQEYIQLTKAANFAICDGDIGYAIKHFQKLVGQYEEELAASRRAQKSHLSTNDKPTKSGLIL